MHWNYRVLHTKTEIAEFNESYYAVYEVYYDETDKPVGCTKNPVHLGWVDDENGADELARFAEALTKPILEYDDLSVEHVKPK